ncbi:MAG: hypothetical protein ACI8P3_002783 [Saprospiraceae bacterium]
MLKLDKAKNMNVKKLISIAKYNIDKAISEEGVKIKEGEEKN